MKKFYNENEEMSKVESMIVNKNNGNKSGINLYDRCSILFEIETNDEGKDYLKPSYGLDFSKILQDYYVQQTCLRILLLTSATKTPKLSKEINEIIILINHLLRKLFR